MGKTLRAKTPTSEAVTAEESRQMRVQPASPTFDVIGHGVRRVPVGVDGDHEGSQVGKILDFIFAKGRQEVSGVRPPPQVDGGVFTDLVHHLDHLLQLFGADVRAVSEAKVDEEPLAQEVLAAPGLLVVVGERERAPQRRTSNRSGPTFFNHCTAGLLGGG